jgi:uncharacterized membrane protein
MIEILPNWHPPLVHLTVGLLFSSAIAYVVAWLPVPEGVRRQALVAARWGLFAGVAVTGATLVAGFQAYNTVAHDGPAHEAMKVHRNWALATAAVFAVAAFVEAWRIRSTEAAGAVVTLLLLAGAAMLTVTGYHGGELVFRHGLGVESLPRIEGHGHGGGIAPDHHDDPLPADHHDAGASDTAGGDSRDAEDTAGQPDEEVEAPDGHEGHDHEH